MIPYRVCCGKQHIGPVCPDNMVMCSLYFGRFSIEELAQDEDGDIIDVCQSCWDYDLEMVRERDIAKCRNQGAAFAEKPCGFCHEGLCDLKMVRRKNERENLA